MHICVVQRLEEGIRSPETGVMDGCEPFWMLRIEPGFSARKKKCP